MISTYVIYCEELQDRVQATRKHLLERGVDATFFRGVHGFTWGLETLREYDQGRRISPGHVGLNLSAWFLYQHLNLTLVDDEDVAVVFEDDVVLPPAWNAELFALDADLERFIPEWQLVYLGLAETEPHVWHKVTERVGSPDSRLCRMNCPFGTHALMLRKSALPVLLDNMALAERNLDQQLWERVLAKGLLRWCAVLPSLVRQRTFDHTLAGKPEWSPSTLEENRPDTPARAAADRERDREEQKRRVSHFDGDDTPGKPSARTFEATAPLLDPFPCLYRGEYIEEVGTDRSGRTVPLSLCARLEVVCHSRAGKTVHAAGQPAPVTACEACTLRTEMAPSDKPRPRLPLPEGHFNPSMAVYNGELILATRDSWGHSRVGLWRLTNDRGDWTGDWACHPVASLSTNHPDAQRLEDPRLFVHGGRLCAMFNLPDKYPPDVVRVGYARFTEDLRAIDHVEIYPSPHGNLYEKNWVPISYDGDLFWVYQTAPDHVILRNGLPVWSRPNPYPWAAGVIRGGAAPVLVDRTVNPRLVRPAYYHFFHGCHKRLSGSVYTIGCTVFEGGPPFRVMRQTKFPLAWPDLPSDSEDVVKRYVLWPGGAVPRAGAWHIACGIDDSFCRILRFPFADVEAALTDVPEASTTVSIRDTPLARGTRA